MKKFIFPIIPIVLFFLVHCSTDSISPTSATVSGAGGDGSVNVKVPSSKSWTASTNSASWDWLGIRSGSNGTGDGTVKWYALPNNSASQRVGTLLIAGRTFTVTQSGKCTYSISPISATVGAGGESGSVSVTTQSGCPWTASTNSGSWDWLGIKSGSNGTGDGTVKWYTLPNKSNSQRIGTLTIGGQTFTVTQAGQ